MYKPIQIKSKQGYSLPIDNIIRCCVIALGLAFSCLLFTGSTSAETKQNDFSCANVSEIPQIECEALVAIYDSTDGPNWDDTTRWLITTLPCSWYGVICKDGHVDVLDLNGAWNNPFGLKGDIPSEIGNFSNLARLDLGYNQLSSLPAEIGNLSNLTWFSLSGNQLSSLPSEIGNLSNLARLYLSSNQLSSLPSEIWTLSNLTTLDLSGNQLSSLPSEVDNLSNLTTLNLGYNQLSSLPSQIWTLSNLTWLSLSVNQLSSLPAQIGNLSNLTTLYLSSNQLSSLPSQIGNLSNLTRLYLGYNQLSSLPAEIGNLSNLTTLYLNSNQLSSLPSQIWTLSNLTTLNLGYNQLSSLPSQIGNLSNLTRLYLGYNQLSSLPSQIGNLSNLTTLYLSGNQLSSLPTEIGNLSNLTTLYFSSNQLSSLPSQISNLSNLTTLYLGYNQLSSLPSQISNLSNLITLDLGYNQLSSLPADIWTFSNLTTLNLSSNQLSSLPSDIWTFSNLTTLNLSSNQLSSLPSDIWTFSNLTTLNLSGNQLSSLPSQIGNLSNLTTLNLSSNQLSSLPAEIGNLSNLATLDLSSNQLSSLPPQIWTLSNLTRLELSSNQLSNLPTEIGNLSNLTRLELSSNQLSSLPAEIWTLSNLTTLDLRSNQLSSLPAEIGNLSNLATLDLSSNQLSSLPSQIWTLSNLTTLEIGYNQLSSLPAEIWTLSNLTTLDLRFNQLGSLPAEIGKLSNLTTLYLHSNHLSSLPSQIVDLSNLTTFYLSSNQLSELPEKISSLIRLTTLDLGHNCLSPTNHNLLAWMNKYDSDWHFTQNRSESCSDPTPTPVTPSPPEPPSGIPDIHVTPTALSATLSEGQSTTLPLTIRNDGDANLTWSMSKQDSGLVQAASVSAQNLPVEKIDPALLEALAENEQADFLIYLTEQAELGAASQASDRDEQGQLVYDALLEVARRSQADLLQWLSTEQTAGHVTDYRSFFIINAIGVTGDHAVVDALAQRADVGYIAAQQIFHMPDPIENLPKSQPVSAAATHDIPWNIRKINAHKAWPEGIDGSGVTIGIIDTGVDYTHPALQTQYRGTETGNHDYNWYDPFENSSNVPIDNVGHGTHVAGIAVGRDGTRQIGVAPGAQWIAARACNVNTCSDDALLKALEWMLAPCPIGVHPPDDRCEASKKPDLVNNSWGGSTGKRIAGKYRFEVAIENLRQAGIVPIFAAGNSGPIRKTILSPASYETTYAVGSINSAEQLASSSSRGPSTVTSKVKPDVSAPGEDIQSSLPGGGYGRDNGTSMASPHVAGIVALMLQAAPDLQLDEIEYILKNTARDLGEAGPDSKYGYGLVDAYAAVQAAGGAESWLTYTPQQGTIKPGKSKIVQVTLNAAGLSSGVVHTADLIINSNDPDTPNMTIPVSLSLSVPEGATESNESYDVYISNITAKRTTITWISSLKTVGKVHYGTERNQLNQIAHDVREGVRERVHYVNIQKIQPKTKYYFKIVNGDQEDDTLRNFTTASDDSILPVESVYGRILKSDDSPAYNVLVHLQIMDGDGKGSPDESAKLTGLTNGSGYWVDPTDDSALNLESILTLDSSQRFNYTDGDKVLIEVLGGEDCDVKRTLSISDISEKFTTQGEAPDLTLSCEQMQDMSLKIGWNGVTSALIQTGEASVTSVLNEADKQNTAIQQIAYWNAEQGSWKAKIVGKPFGNFPILPCQGYFVRATEPSLLQIPPMTSIHKCNVVLKRSWNFISLPTTAPALSASAACIQIKDQGGLITELAYWNHAKSDWSIHICGQPIGDFEMESRNPYFIKSNRASTWVPQTSAARAANNDDQSINTGLLAASNPTITDIRYANINDRLLTVIWRTDQPATSQIRFGNQSGELINIAHDDRGEAYVGYIHQVTLTGLRAETVYQLEIASGETVDDNQGQYHVLETSPTLAIPAIQTAYSQVLDSAGLPAVGAQVYVTVSDGGSLSAVTNAQGYWTLNLGALRTADGTAYLDVTDGMLAIEVITPAGITDSQSIAMENLTPAPTLILENQTPISIQDRHIYLPFITH